MTTLEIYSYVILYFIIGTILITRLDIILDEAPTLYEGSSAMAILFWPITLPIGLMLVIRKFMLEK